MTMSLMQRMQQMGIKKKILVIHGPNMQIKSDRDTGITQPDDIEELNTLLVEHGEAFWLECTCWHSNIEGEMVSRIHQAKGQYHGMVINAGSYRYYSLAIRDAISAVKLPTVEVNTCNYARTKKLENPGHSVLEGVCVGQIVGFGAHSYYLALEALAEML